MFCHSCGSKVSKSENFCAYCGVKIIDVKPENTDEVDSPKAKTILVFGLLGVLGIISCGLLSFFSIPAWIMGNNELKIHPDDERIKAGRIMGIAGVIMLSITVIFVVILVSSVVDKIPMQSR